MNGQARLQISRNNCLCGPIEDSRHFDILALGQGGHMADKGSAEQLQFPQLVDIRTTARLLGVTERYVRRMVAERQIEVVKIGHYVRFDLAIVRDWVERRRRPPADAVRR